MGKEKDLQTRVDLKFAEDIKMASIERARKGFANPLKKSEMSMREMTALTRRTSAWKQVLEELRTKPKRRNLV